MIWTAHKGKASLLHSAVAGNRLANGEIMPGGGGKRFMEGQSKEPYSKQRDLMAADSTFDGCSSMSQLYNLL